MSSPWETAPKASFNDDLDLKQYVGCTCLFGIGGYHAQTPSKFENNSRVSGFGVALDGPNAGQVFKGKIRNERPKRRFRSSAGKVHLGKLVSEMVAGNEAIDLAEMTEYDDRLAKAWSAYYPGVLEQLLAEAVATFAKDEADYRTELAQQDQPQPQAQSQASRAQWTDPQPSFPSASASAPTTPNGGNRVAPSAPPPWGQQWAQNQAQNQAAPQPQFPPAAAPPPPPPPQPVTSPSAPWLNAGVDQPPY